LKKLLQSGLIIFAAIILISCGAKEAPKDPLAWDTNLQNAVIKARATGKPILVNFTGSDWCKWCQKLNEEVFHRPEFVEYAQKNLILVKLDFPRTIEQSNATKEYNESMLQTFGVQGFPTILLLNSEGQTLLQTGYQPGGPLKYIEHLEEYM